MKTVSHFDEFDLGGLVVSSAERDFKFIVTNYTLLAVYAHKSINQQ